MSNAMRTPSGAPSQKARDLHGGKEGEFPIFDHKSAHSALMLRGHAPDPAKIIARVRAWANKNNDKVILAECDAATEKDKKSSNTRSSDFTTPTELAEIETRMASVGEVNFKHRIITLVAVPYESPAQVPFRGEVWSEVFSRNAFERILNSRPTRIRVNREHDRNRTFGKVVKFFPERDDALVAEVRAAQTPLGDESLALADEDCLSASVGFGVLDSGQELNRFSKTRRINSAYLDHLALVESPAYSGADVLSVRKEQLDSQPSPISVETPKLNAAMEDIRSIMQWTEQRLNR